jgi:hypothetical protein
MGMRRVKEIDNWLYRIELMERNKKKRISFSKGFRRKKNARKYYE